MEKNAQIAPLVTAFKSISLSLSLSLCIYICIYIEYICIYIEYRCNNLRSVLRIKRIICLYLNMTFESLPGKRKNLLEQSISIITFWSEFMLRFQHFPISLRLLYDQAYTYKVELNSLYNFHNIYKC